VYIKKYLATSNTATIEVDTFYGQNYTARLYCYPLYQVTSSSVAETVDYESYKSGGDNAKLVKF